MKAIEENLAFLASVIHRLELNANVPQSIADAQLHNVECAALDVFATVMEYLTNGIQYFSQPLIGQ